MRMLALELHRHGEGLRIRFRVWIRFRRVCGTSEGTQTPLTIQQNNRRQSNRSGHEKIEASFLARFSKPLGCSEFRATLPELWNAWADVKIKQIGSLRKILTQPFQPKTIRFSFENGSAETQIITVRTWALCSPSTPCDPPVA